MTVISVKLEYGSTQGPRIAPDGTHSYEETWIVRTNNPNDRGDIIRNASGLPKQGNQYPEDAGAIVTNVDPVQESEQQRVWRVAIKYDSKSTKLPSEDGQVAQNPLERPAIISWSSALIEKTFPKDLDGKPFVDMAGSPFDPPPAIPFSNLILTIQRNEAGIDPFRIVGFVNGVNQVDFFGIPRGHVLMTGFSANQGFGNGVPFWDVSYQFEVSKDLWIPFLILNAGPRYHPPFKSTGGDFFGTDLTKLVVAKDSDGVAHNGIVLLNAEGGLLNPNPDDNNPPVFLEFRLYDFVDFNQLNLP